MSSWGNGWLPNSAWSFMIAKGERDGVLGAHQRTAAFDVGQQRRPVAGDEGQVHGRALAVGLRLGLEEVGIAVDEEQAIAAAPPQREHRAQHDRAVAAQHHRKLARVQHRLYSVGELGRPRRDRLGIQDPGFGIGRRILRRHGQPPGAARMDALRKAQIKEPVGQALHAVGRQTQCGRRFEDCIGDGSASEGSGRCGLERA